MRVWNFFRITNSKLILISQCYNKKIKLIYFFPSYISLIEGNISYDSIKPTITCGIIYQKNFGVISRFEKYPCLKIKKRYIFWDTLYFFNFDKRLFFRVWNFFRISNTMLILIFQCCNKKLKSIKIFHYGYILLKIILHTIH